jgi:hypothetical protein
MGDVMKVIGDGRWDLIILHPDCTAMAVSGNRWYGKGMPYHQKRLEAVEWTMALWDKACRHCPRVALENPASVFFTALRESHPETDVQYIQPHEYGHPQFKKTGLALHGLSRLKPTDPLKVPEKGTPEHWEWQKVFRMAPSESRGADRSVTFLGIADAMGEQWSVEP